MKRALKIILITLASIAGVVFVVTGVLCAIIFTPNYITPIVQNQANKYTDFKIELSKADLVFFRTFPYFSIEVDSLRVSDSTGCFRIAEVPSMQASVDIMAFIKRGDLNIGRVILKDGYADLSKLPYSSEPDSATVAKDSSSAFSLPAFAVNIEEVSIENLHFIYGARENMYIEALGMDLDLSGNNMNELLSGEMGIEIESVDLYLNDTLYCDRLPFSLRTRFEMEFPNMALSLHEAIFKAGEVEADLSGMVAFMAPEGGIETDLKLILNGWDLRSVMEVLPDHIAGKIDETYSPSGKIFLDAAVTGTYRDSLFPIVEARVRTENVALRYREMIPYDITEVESDMLAKVDLNKESASKVSITNLSARAASNTLQVSGEVDDLLGKMNFDLDLKADLSISEIVPILPEKLNIAGTGRAMLDISAKSDLGALRNIDTDKMSLEGDVKFSEVDLTYNDTLFLQSPSLGVGFAMAPAEGKYGEARLTFSSVDFTAGSDIYAVVTDGSLSARLPGKMKELEAEAVECLFDLGGISAQVKDMEAAVVAPQGNITLERLSPSKMLLGCSYTNEYIYFAQGNDLFVETDSLRLNLHSLRDTLVKGSLLAEWRPELDLSFDGGEMRLNAQEKEIALPTIALSYTDDTLRLHNSRLQVAESDFELRGKIYDIEKYLEQKGLLTANLDFISQKTDIDAILDMVSGFGAKDTTYSAEAGPDAAETETETAEEGDPFMVPLGVDVTLNTDIGRALAMGQEIQNVGGKVTVKDGVLIIRQLGFTSDAAKMQLTAMYKSPRRNHLFVGLDFHLLDIQIDKLIDMVPQVDSIVPMLKSFAGEAEFHLAVETNLNAKYQLKKSTLLGAAAIEGENLVVLDSETFDKMASMLKFEKSQENRIDSLAVDMTVFRNEVDIYPFVVSMDKYKFILSGRHNLDMSFNYHVDCLWPVRLGLDVKGRVGDLKFALTPTRYKNLFVPERRNDIQERTLKLMNIINTSLKSTVVED